MRRLGGRGFSNLSYAARILIVDDEPEVRAFFEQRLLEDGYHVTAVGTARQGLRALNDGEFQGSSANLVQLRVPFGQQVERAVRMEGCKPVTKGSLPGHTSAA